jgi:hypothetical protein
MWKRNNGKTDSETEKLSNASKDLLDTVSDISATATDLIVQLDLELGKSTEDGVRRGGEDESTDHSLGKPKISR